VCLTWFRFRSEALTNVSIMSNCLKTQLLRSPPEGGANCARDWRDLATAQPGPERESAESRKARFFAEQKMRPNNFVQEEAL
jgi:hypothetical protein